MEIIGVGGMAVVYKAFDNMDQRTVAVKILKDEYIANEEFKRRFKNESKAIAVLSHPNIVKVFDVSYGDMLQYIVMEYVEGITLKEYTQQQGKVNPREAIYFLTQILYALQHAHDKGIVHRDVKPQNIMLQSDGTIKVTDFGIARFSRSETRTMTDCAIGSVHYISPEQAKGNLTDAKTDLYAVGVVFYEMLTGSLPFQSDNAVSVALMQLQKDPVMPRALNPDISVGLEQIIMKAMQKNVVDRYQSASEMLNDLDMYKKNPNIKFNYSFSSTGAADTTEESPEETISLQHPASVVREPVAKKTKVKEEIDYSEDEIDNKTKMRNLALLSGALVALIVFAVILIGLFSGNKKKVEVPKLVGLNYYDSVVNNTLYSGFRITPNFKTDSTEADGTILQQDPEEGKKVQPGAEIIIYIAGSGTGIEIPKDIIGKNFSAVENELKALGFVVTIVKEKNEKAKVGSVLRTDPRVGEKIEPGSDVTIYVATNEDVEPVAVPDLLGKTVDEAKAALEAAGLKYDSERSSYRNSSVDAGIVIGYEKAGEKVLPGTPIAVYISNGISDTATTTESTTESTTATTTATTTTEAPETTTTEPYEVTEAPTEPPEEVVVTIYIPTTEPQVDAPEENTDPPEDDVVETPEEPVEDPQEPADDSGESDEIIVDIGEIAG